MYPGTTERSNELKYIELYQFRARIYLKNAISMCPFSLSANQQKLNVVFIPD